MKLYITKSYFLQYKIQAQFPHVSLRSESFQQELFSPPMKVGKSHKLHGTHLSLVATKNVAKEVVGLIFNISSGSEANITTPCEMEIFNFLWLIWDHYIPLAPT